MTTYPAAVICEESKLKDKAVILADHLNIPLMQSLSDEMKDKLLLIYTEAGLMLSCNDLQMSGDFESLIPRIRKNNLDQELLVKAVRKIKKPASDILIYDATAGMGEDSFLLAAAGFQIRLFESDPVIAALLKDSLERAAQNTQINEIVNRMHVMEGDSIQLMKQAEYQPDVVYLDPMFPERRKSGLVKKKFQLIHYLERPCSNEEELYQAALDVKPKRIVIKRPLKGPYLCGQTPTFTLEGKAIRYDCIVFPEN